MLKHGDTPVDTIFIHCAATRPSWREGQSLSEKVNEIRRWHVDENGWRDIGYHWVIDRDGSVMEGRAETEVGAHVGGHNRGSIGICLLGGHGSNENDEFSDHFTPEQEQALKAKIAEIKGRANIKRIRGHNEVAAKACPGFRVSRWLKGRSSKRSAAESRTVQGSSTAMAGGVGAALSEQAEAIEPVAHMSDTLRVIFVILIIAGAAYALYARLDDRKKGRD